VNSKLQIEEPRVPGLNRKTFEINHFSPRARNSSINQPLVDFDNLQKAVDGCEGGQQKNLISAEPKSRNGELRLQDSSRRRLIFRFVRRGLAGALGSSGAFYSHSTLTTATSEQAYINAEITALRAPISGELQLEALAPGRNIEAGTILFRVENPRYGNQEATSQLNWVSESADRLRAESEEASVRFRQQEEVYQLHEKLYAEKILSRLALLEEQSKLALAGAAMTNKQTLAAQAEGRSRDVKRQVDLQKAVIVKMPFDGVAWAFPAKNGAEVSTREPVVELIDPKRVWVDAFFHERHAHKIVAGTKVNIRSLDEDLLCTGTVEWIRGGVGRIAYEGTVAVGPGDYTRRRIAVRVKLDTGCPFEASNFLGIGRSVVITVVSHE
jgi:multidrug resistance efflux pump